MIASSNKSILKNSILIYIRMFFIMLVTLYTVRISLNILGVEDYGIYNVVAGVVAVMTCVTSALQTAMQRFYSYFLGLDVVGELNKVFNVGLIIYAILALFIILVGESVGLWFLKNKMVIPLDKLDAAIIIFHFSIFSFVLTILTIPFSSLIIAYEHIAVYALGSVLYAVLSLIFIFSLSYLSVDRLVWYGVFIFLATVIREGLFFSYCRIKYNCCRIRFYWDKQLLLSMFSYSGWTFWGTIASVANNQGNNILINVFFGPLANAARAVALQVSNALGVFSNNLFVVVTPPIIKSYAIGNYEYVLRLFYLSSKFSYFLLYMLFLPLIFETEFILRLWLHDITDYMVIFTRLSLIYSLILVQHNPITAIVQATGKIKMYFSIVESVTLLSLPLTYIFYKIGFPAQSTFYVSIGVFLFAHVLRVVILNKLIDLSISEYLKKFIIPICSVSLITLFVPYLICTYMESSMMRLILVFCCSVLCVISCALFVGLDVNERKQVYCLMGKLKYRIIGR